MYSKKSVALAIATLILPLTFSAQASTSQNITFFPPANKASCAPGTSLLSWDGTASTSCLVDSSVIATGLSQIVGSSGCPAGQVLTFTGGVVKCIAAAGITVPTCTSGTVLTGSSGALSCIIPPSSGGSSITVPSCPGGYFLTGSGGSLVCAAAPTSGGGSSITVPNCPAGQALTGSNGSLGCMNVVPYMMPTLTAETCGADTISAWYEACLGRCPDQGGYNYWIATNLGGTPMGPISCTAGGQQAGTITNQLYAGAVANGELASYQASGQNDATITSLCSGYSSQFPGTTWHYLQNSSFCIRQ
jgi:hypothetical protein